MTGARLTEAEAARDLGRLYAELGRGQEAHAVLREAAQAFEDLGATGDAAATTQEMRAVGWRWAETVQAAWTGQPFTIPLQVVNQQARQFELS